MNTNRQPFCLGFSLGLLSSICSVVIAIVLANHKQVPTEWVLLIQSFLSLIVGAAISTLFAAQARPKRFQLRTERYPLHLSRAAVGLGIYWFYYQALKHAPKVDCSLLLNTAPLFVPFLCFLLFRESVSLRVRVGLVTGFAGVVLVLTPELAFAGNSLGYVLAALAGVLFASSIVIVRSLNRTEAVATTVSYYNLHCVAAMCLILAANPKGVAWPDVSTCLVVGAAFCVKQYAITLSIRFASATIAAVLNFATIPMLAAYSVVVEGDLMSTSVSYGSVLVGAGIFVVLFPERPKASNPACDFDESDPSAFASKSRSCEVR